VSVFVRIITVVEALFLELLMLKMGGGEAETHGRSLRRTAGPGTAK
jgi:hypothetical protein